MTKKNEIFIVHDFLLKIYLYFINQKNYYYEIWHNLNNHKLSSTLILLKVNKGC